MLANKLSAATVLVAICTSISFASLPRASEGDDKQPPNADRREDDALQVIVDPPKGPVRVKESFDLRLRVVNKSDKAQSFRVMNCSWFDHWKSSNERVSIIGWGCSKNFAVPETLQPNQAYEKSLAVQISEGRPHEKVSFKMGFTPIDSKRTYWSQELTVEMASNTASQ